jgi:hypothetical protein
MMFIDARRGRLRTLALAITVAVAGHLGRQPTTTQAADELPPPQPQAQIASTGETEHSTGADGSNIYRVSGAFDLDQYLYRASSPLNFSIDIQHDYGPVTIDGSPEAVGSRSPSAALQPCRGVSGRTVLPGQVADSVRAPSREATDDQW